MAAPEPTIEGISNLSEEIVDKLGLLNYEQGFLKQRSSFKPLLPDYFAIAINPNDQFNYFKA